jgi:hypothetical protein
MTVNMIEPQLQARNSPLGASQIMTSSIASGDPPGRRALLVVAGGRRRGGSLGFGNFNPASATSAS